MAKKLLSEQVVNRWAKLSGVKLNEMYGGMTGERDDEMDMGADEMPPIRPSGRDRRTCRRSRLVSEVASGPARPVRRWSAVSVRASPW